MKLHNHELLLLKEGALWLAAALIAAVLAFGCAADESGEAEAATSEAATDVDTSEAPAVNVHAETLTADRLEDKLFLSGRLEPWVEVEVSTELGGTVQEVGFEKGRNVAKGQVLARVGTDLLEASLAEAEAELAAAEADFNKTTELFDRQAVPRQDLTEATSLYKRAEARVQQAKLRVERSIIRAPVAGVAVSRDIEDGEVLAPGAHITSIHQVSRLKAVAGIPENDISYFRVGGDVGVEVDAYPGEKFTGKIHFLAPAASEQNRTFQCEIALDNASGELRPGLIVRLSLVRRVFDEAIVVARDAVLERDEGNVAFVVEDGRARERKVKTGASEAGRIVILDGLAPGEKIIVSGHRNLVDGQRVRVVEEGT